MMKFTNTLLILVVIGYASAVEEEKLPLRRLRQQTLHIPDLFEMSADSETKSNEWYASTKSSQQNLMNSRRNVQKISEMDVFARLLQSDSSLSLSMPTAPTPAVPTPIVPTPLVPTPKVPTPKAPIPVPPLPVAPVPTAIPPVPIAIAPIPVVPAPVPVVTSCPAYPGCVSLGLTGDCCPTVEGIFLDCCFGITLAPATTPTVPSGPTIVSPTIIVPTLPAPVAAPKSKGSMSSKVPSSKGVVSPTDSGSKGSMSSSEPSSKSSMSSSKGPTSGSMSSSKS